MTTSNAEPFCHCLNALPVDNSIRAFADGVNEVRRQRSTRGSFAFQLGDACTDSQTVQREHALGAMDGGIRCVPAAQIVAHKLDLLWQRCPLAAKIHDPEEVHWQQRET